MTEVTFYPVADVCDDLPECAVVMTQEQGKWLFCRHKAKDSWEIPSGHRRQGESITETARRALYETTGVTEADIMPVEAFRMTREDGKQSHGVLFLARMNMRTPLSSNSEMWEIMSAHLMPKELTYPDIHPALFSRVQYRLNIKANAQELWDVLDEHRTPTGRTHPRGVPLPMGDYHLIVLVLLQNEQGDFLITRRAPNKGYPNMWEFTGGSALAGDDTLRAALREMREETGIVLDPAGGHIVATERWSDSFCDVWLFRQSFDVSAVVLQEGETTAAMVASRERIIQMEREGELVPFTPALRKLMEQDLQ